MSNILQSTTKPKDEATRPYRVTLSKGLRNGDFVTHIEFDNYGDWSGTIHEWTIKDLLRQFSTIRKK